MFTQEELEDIYDRYYLYPYELAKIFTEEVPNQNNFYKNSIGIFEPANTPHRQPDYTSSHLHGHTSYYWYTDKGVYRQSDHWGVVGTCIWFYDIFYSRWDNTDYEGQDEETIFFDAPVTGFIRYENLYALGEISCNKYGECWLYGFSFK